VSLLMLFVIVVAELKWVVAVVYMVIQGVSLLMFFVIVVVEFKWVVAVVC
jgi:hypothetical protein